MAAIEKSIGAITWSAISTTVTSAPASWRFSAISRPMKPPPMTTARFTSRLPIYCFMASVSLTLRRVKIPSRSMPGSGGFTGDAPGDSSSLS